MLHEFVSANRDELIRRCRSKVSKRKSPPVTEAELQYGVPQFLGQLVEALRYEEAGASRKRVELVTSWYKTPVAVESRRTAALHGKALLDEGYTIDQVVHDYGDICQSITELAVEKRAPITVEEFHTFNRLLDNAIADAVASYGRHRDESISGPDQGLHDRLGALADEQRRLLTTALKALDALKGGNVGLRGATGTLLEESLLDLQVLIDKSLPELRLSAGMTTPPKP